MCTRLIELIYLKRISLLNDWLLYNLLEKTPYAEYMEEPKVQGLAPYDDRELGWRSYVDIIIERSYIYGLESIFLRG